MQRTWKSQRRRCSGMNSYLRTVSQKQKSSVGAFGSRSDTVLIKCQMCTCRLETPAAEMTPNITRNMPPITGSGIVVKMAATFPIMPMTTIKTPLNSITIRLPTYKNNNRNDSSQGYLQIFQLKKLKSFIVRCFFHLCNTKGSNILTVGCCTISCAPGSG